MFLLVHHDSGMQRGLPSCWSLCFVPTAVDAGVTGACTLNPDFLLEDHGCPYVLDITAVKDQLQQNKLTRNGTYADMRDRLWEQRASNDGQQLSKC